MKAVLVGGLTRQSGDIARSLASREDMTEIVIADHDHEKAKEVATEIGGKTSAAHVDIFDRGSVIALIRGADVVVNSAGVDWEMSPPVIEAAIEAHVNYVDWKHYFDAGDDTATPALAFDKRAKEAGVTILCGMGHSPGQTNILCRYAADRLDRVDDIFISSVVPGCRVEPEPSMWAHRLEIWGGNAPVVRDGRLIAVPVGTEKETVVWPEPVGAVEVAVRRHSEPLTLGRYIRSLKNVTVKGCYTNKDFADLIQYLGKLGFASRKPVQVGSVSVSPLEFFGSFSATEEFRQSSVMQKVLESKRTISNWVGWRVEVTGEKAGKPARYIYRLFSNEQDLGRNIMYTGAAVGAYMLARGDINARGVLFPEALDPKPVLRLLLQELAKRHVSWEESSSLTGGTLDVARGL